MRCMSARTPKPRTTAGGGNEFRIRTAELTALRAFKFLYLLPAMAFAYQQGLNTGTGEPQVGPGTRLQSIAHGHIADLLGAVLTAARAVPTQRPPAAEPTAVGAAWTSTCIYWGKPLAVVVFWHSGHQAAVQPYGLSLIHI